jgi:predicted anti-sigma-YlaC factor YlaD
MQCKELELVLEQEGLESLPGVARAHLAECRDCRNYVADLTSLVDAAKKLPSEITPPDRVWISLRAQLEAEGIIRTPAEIVLPESASWWPSISAFFRNRVVATAMVGILIAAAAVFQIRSDREVPSGEFAGTAQALNDQEPVATSMILASTSPVDASLRDNLKKVNEFIADCERHLKEQPQDELTREYLSAAYQQKAELLSAMIERGRSMN